MGKTGFTWLSFRLAGKELTELELVDTGDASSDFDDFLTRAFPSKTCRFNYLHFHYDLGIDGRRSKTVAFLYTPSDAPVREKMLSASARPTLGKILGATSISMQTGNRHELSPAVVQDKCMSVSR